MRLLHVERLEFAYFSDDKIPKYVIASHRWYPDAEATFEDVRNKQDTDKAGYQKITAFAKYIKDNCPQIDWLWIDTCCINKDSAAELSEAINLMFKWYRNAEICLAYLADVDKKAEFGRSEWFKRGWTLQELLAPRTVLFLSRDWEVVGNKGAGRTPYAGMPAGPGLEEEISSVTGIPEEVLHDYGASRSIGNDEKLKWMDGRLTTRPEDMSYALYGICGVTPGANYGEQYDGARQRLLAAINYQGNLAAQQAERYRKIVDWLSPCDPWINHQAARNRHEAQTGNWLIESDDYRAWKLDNVRHLWIHGKAGCGKTIVCSSVIEDVQSYCADHLETGYAIFYFSFSDERKTQYEDLLLSLVSQLGNRGLALEMLKQEYNKPNRKIPGPDVLERVLVACVQSYKQFFLILDALDESPEENDCRHHLLIQLSRLTERLSQLKILATSRELPDVRTSMTSLKAKSLPIATHAVNADIRRYVATEMLRDHRLSRLDQSTKAHIEDTLSGRADGMFRWAFCQLQELKKLKLTKPSLVQQALFSLPRTLDETYERMLNDIDQRLREEALTLLRWLAYARSPLALAELVDTTVINLAKDTIHVNDRPGIYDTLELLAGLVCVEGNQKNVHHSSLRESGNHGFAEDDLNHQLCRSQITKDTRIRLAHFSVKEYLESERILESRAKESHLDGGREHRFLCQSCLVYLWYCHKRAGEPLTPFHTWLPEYAIDLDRLPLIGYAAESWYYHASLQHAGEVTREVRLLGTRAALEFWVWCHSPDGTTGAAHHIPSGLYYASYLGFEAVAIELLAKGADINAEGGKHHHALGAAACQGYDSVVQVLLDAGPNVQARSESLLKATDRGYETTVKLLLEVDTNSEKWGDRYGDALHSAASSGHEYIAQMLINAGANVNASRRGEGILYAASKRGYDKIVEELLRAGAEIQGPSGRNQQVSSSALHTAIVRRFESIVQMLLSAGADVDALGGADVDALGRPYGRSTPLQLAADTGSIEIVEMLLSAGAGANGPQGVLSKSSALFTAVKSRNEAMARMLLRAGADAYVVVRRTSTHALCIAAHWGNETTVRMLLNVAADANTPREHFAKRDALRIVAKRGSDRIVQLLLDAGTDANTLGAWELGRRYGTLSIAAETGNENIVQSMLSAGFDANTPRGSLWDISALYAAVRNGNENIVEMLLDAGAGISEDAARFQLPPRQRIRG